MDEQQDKRTAVMGRPLKFKSVAELQQKVDEYFGSCDPHVATRQILRQKVDGSVYLAEEQYITEQVPYAITDLALALDTSRETLLDYQSGKYDDPERGDSVNGDFSDTIKRAKLRCQAFAERHLFTGKQATGAIFSLKNNYGWEDRVIRENEGGLFGEGRRLEVEIVNPEPPNEATAEPDPEPSPPPTS